METLTFLFTDMEGSTVLLRRLDPGLLTLVIGTTGPAGQHQAGPGPLPDALSGALARYAARHDGGALVPAAGPADDLAPAGTWGPSECTRQLATAYVCRDCVDDDVPGSRSAYLRLPVAERRRLHDARAAELEATGEFSWRLGAIP